MKNVDINGHKEVITDANQDNPAREHKPLSPGYAALTSAHRHLTSHKNPINEKFLSGKREIRVMGESENRLLSSSEMNFDLTRPIMEQSDIVGREVMNPSEYNNRRNQLFTESVDFANKEDVNKLWGEMVQTIRGVIVPELVEPVIEQTVTEQPKPVIRGIEDWDIRLSNKPLKTWLVQHIRSTDMPPMAPSIVFHVDDTEAEPINVEHLTNLHLKSQPFDDYTLAYNVMQEHSSEDQYEFIRVMRLRGDMVMCVFAINIFGDWEYKYRVNLNKFQIVNCIPRYPHGDIITSQKFNKVSRTATELLDELRELSSHAQKQYLRVARFLRDFEDYDQEVVVKLGSVESVRGRNRNIQESYVEYTLDKSKTKRVKRIEEEERERAKWVKEDPKTREHERIGHKRHLADGRVIKVRGSVVNPGSPLGKVIKDYKFSK